MEKIFMEEFERRSRLQVSAGQKFLDKSNFTKILLSPQLKIILKLMSFLLQKFQFTIFFYRV